MAVKRLKEVAKLIQGRIRSVQQQQGLVHLTDEVKLCKVEAALIASLVQCEIAITENIDFEDDDDLTEDDLGDDFPGKDQ